MMRNMMRQFGGLKAFGLWWLLIELLDRHGNGDKVLISWRELEQQGMTGRAYIRSVVGWLVGESAIVVTLDNENTFGYEIEKFRKKHANRKTKVHSKSVQSPSKVSIYREVEVERDCAEKVEPVNNSKTEEQICGLPASTFSKLSFSEQDIRRREFNEAKPKTKIEHSCVACAYENVRPNGMMPPQDCDKCESAIMAGNRA